MNNNWIDQYYVSEFAEHLQAAEAAREALRQPFGEMVATCVAAVRDGGKLMFFGNGGSAADAQHLATELSIRYSKDRAPIAALALTTDTSALTAGGNDLGFDQVFARQVEALAKPGDVAIGISTSGTSPNVIAGLKMAKAKGCKTIVFSSVKMLSSMATVAPAQSDSRFMSLVSGGSLHFLSGNPDTQSADIILAVPSTTTARIQEMHITVGHMLCGALEAELGLVGRGDTE